MSKASAAFFSASGRSMKKSMKKTLSILLSVVMITSVFTALPLSAGAEDTVTDEKAILLGDVDTDTEVAILDATAIQRTLASLPVASYSDKAADVDGDGEITIVAASLIQKHLSGIDTGRPIDTLVE